MLYLVDLIRSQEKCKNVRRWFYGEMHAVIISWLGAVTCFPHAKLR